MKSSAAIALLFPLLPLVAAGAIGTFAHYPLGEAGSLGTNKLPLDLGAGARHFATALSGNTAEVTTDGMWAAGSTAALSTASTAADGWYGSNVFSGLPADNFGFGVFARAGSITGTTDVFTLGSSNASLKLSLGSSGWAASAHNVSWIGPAYGVAGSFSPNTWVHLAVVRKAGVSTFYLNGVAKGTWSGTPIHNSPHLSVNPSSSGYFHGEMDEARVVTFAASDADADILHALWGAAELPPTPPAQTLLEQTFATVAGKRHVVTFTLSPGAGQAVLPGMTLGVAGASTLIEQALPLELPAGGGSAPFRIAFTADAAQTVVRITRPAGAATPDPVVTGMQVVEAVEPAPSAQPSAAQQSQIDRRYGMFIHFGINTFHNQQWTDGTKPSSSYAPTGLDVDQWVKTARDAGMRHIILTAKHHEGFCMWDSPWTTYDVASSPVPTDVVAAAAAACAKYGVGLGIYYSLWDRHEPAYGNDAAYNQYMLRQLAELLGNYGPVCELWLDGGWDKANTRWANSEIYDLAKRLQPGCLVSTNWTVGTATDADSHGIVPANQQEGFLIRYFPNDFRLADPYLAKFPDPKLFKHQGQDYYLPFEATITLSSANYWFYDTRDTTTKPLATLADYYYSATAQNNILILNAPPDRSGVIREVDRQGLFQLRDRLGLNPGMPLPENVTGAATGTASAVWNNDVANHGPQKALDGDPGTRWASGPVGLTSASVEIDFGAPRSFDRLLIDEFEVAAGVGRIQAFHLDAWDGAAWQTFHTGTTCRRHSLHDFARQHCAKIRLVITSASDAPSIWEIQAHDASHAFSSWRDERFPGSGILLEADWDADPDGDRLPNRLEFVLGSDPHAATSLPVPTRDGAMMKLALPWNLEAGGDFGSIRYSFDLHEWFDSLSPAHAGVQVASGPPGQRAWQIDPAQLPSWFYRLE
ncbi:alpha-L-fucosidase [Luteolibacter arcticus]|uniref:alpha-L-fucosidase n=1 Tax=Luteolibacter arcticus TaxID=1581411 RepID=A0ABT3GLP7_9BACT|nr:alpha-L-fucosidase [Luteolibacter arcticus]MCW1924436.1 alpha-L-fucosidase [Luteolibacter arcticus]